MEIYRPNERTLSAEETRNEHGLYIISLPWSEDKLLLPDNLCITKKRLTNVRSKLFANNLYENYDEVLVRMAWRKIF